MTYKNLTWKDIQMIVHIADRTIELTSKKELLAIGEEGYYKTVLHQVTETLSKQPEDPHSEDDCIICCENCKWYTGPDIPCTHDTGVGRPITECFMHKDYCSINPDTNLELAEN